MIKALYLPDAITSWICFACSPGLNCASNSVIFILFALAILSISTFEAFSHVLAELADRYATWIGDAADAEVIPVNPAASIDTASAAAAIARVLRRDDERRFISSPYARIL
jgi:hypothetical protein